MSPFIFGVDFFPSMDAEAVSTFSIHDRVSITDRIKSKKEECFFEHFLKGLEDHAEDE